MEPKDTPIVTKRPKQSLKKQKKRTTNRSDKKETKTPIVKNMRKTSWVKNVNLVFKEKYHVHPLFIEDKPLFWKSILQLIELFINVEKRHILKGFNQISLMDILLVMEIGIKFKEKGYISIWRVPILITFLVW